MLLKKVADNIFEYYYKNYINTLINKDFKPNQYLFFENTKEIEKKMIRYKSYSIEIEKEYNDSYFSDNRELLPYITIQYYAGYFHEKINDYLRGVLSEFHKSLILDEIIKRTEILQNEINKFQLESNVVVIRRVSNTFFKNAYLKGEKIKKNIIIQDLGFLSTSLDLFYRKDYQSDYAPLKNETIMIIKVPKGIGALYIEPISKRDEFELLLDCNLNMRVENKKSILGNNIVLTQVIK